MMIRETCFQCAVVTKTRNFVSQNDINGTGIKWVFETGGFIAKHHDCKTREDLDAIV